MMHCWASVVAVAAAALLVLLHGASTAALALGGSYPCVYEFANITYDLTVLTGTTDLTAVAASYTYQWNPCARVNSAPCVSRSDSPSMCEINGVYFEATLAYVDEFKTPAPVWELIDSLEPMKGVRVTYRNGDYCWGSPTYERITVINYICDTTKESRPPTFKLTQSPACTFTIDYPNAAVCARSPVIDSCKYVDEVSGLTWDLNPLHTSGDINGYLSPYNYSLNICDYIEKQGACRDAGHSLCQYNFRGEFVAGLGGFYRTPKGIWSFITTDPTVGIRQTYRNGEPCIISGRQVARTSIINFYCDPKGTRVFTLTTNPNTCTFTFDFRVPEGCPHR